MKIAVLVPEHRNLFADMDPFFFLERGDFPNRICVGAVEEKAGKEADDPAGLMILKLGETTVTLEWIFVKGEYRMKGIGTALMEYAFSFAQDMGAAHLALYLSQNRERTLLCPYESEFLNEYSFIPVSVLSGEWSTDIGSLIKHPAIGVGADKNKATVPVSELKGRRFDALKEYVSGQPATDFLYNREFIVDLSDKDVSRVVLSNVGISGAIFVQESGQSLYVTGLCSSARLDELALLHGALLSAKKKYGADKRIVVLECGEKYKGMLKGLFAGEPVRSCFYEATVKDYMNNLDSFIKPQNRLLAAGMG